MGKAWIYMCIPPVLGLLVFAVVKSAGSVNVPTQAQIDAALARVNDASPKRGGGRSQRFDPKRLAEALRVAGIGQDSSSNSAGTSTVRPKTTHSSSTNPKRLSHKELIKRYNDLIKNHKKGVPGNIRAHKNGIIAGIVAAVVGYAIVVTIIYQHYKRRATWKDALAAGQNYSSAREPGEG